MASTVGTAGIVVILAALILGCGSSSPTPTHTPNPTPSPTPTSLLTPDWIKDNIRNSIVAGTLPYCEGISEAKDWIQEFIESSIASGLLLPCDLTGEEADSGELNPFERGLKPADALAQYDDNGNGRITCAEARAHGIAPVPQGHPAYPFMRDGDGDGIVCE